MVVNGGGGRQVGCRRGAVGTAGVALWGAGGSSSSAREEMNHGQHSRQAAAGRTAGIAGVRQVQVWGRKAATAVEMAAKIGKEERRRMNYRWYRNMRNGQV